MEQERVLDLGVPLGATLALPDGARGVVAFAHGSGSSRFSPRNKAVASTLNDARFATLLIDLLTEDEEWAERHTRHLRFDIDLLAGRLIAAVGWLIRAEPTAALPIGLFGASTGAAAALVAAAREPDAVRAVVSRGGRPDLARDALAEVRAPTLLIVGGRDVEVLGLNHAAQRAMSNATVDVEIVDGATHLFEERGALERVAALALAHFERYLG
jgi:putative phosphoribosyl transferase